MQQGSVHDDVIESRAVGRPMLIKVILPPGYQPDADTPYPVLYFLHPWGLSPRYLTDKLRIQQHLWDGIARGALPPMIVALPTGERSFYLNAADPSGQDWSDVMNRAERFFHNALEQYGRYGDYLLGEAIPHVEQRYRVRRDRAGRAMGGISMGGAAAAVHGFSDPSRFSAIGIHSPAVFEGPPEKNGPPWIFGLDQASFAARNPADQARRLTPQTQPRIYLDCGDHDALLPAVELVHRALDECGIAHQYIIHPGGHDKTYWEPHMPEYLAFYAQAWQA
ncbi:MAG: esterase family protein [Chloroflexi bacterium]|nr:esterase family protein [Chloroflexota bacterium]